MKALFIIGVLLIVGGYLLASYANKPLTALSSLGQKTVTFAIVAGFLMIGLSSVMYFKKTSE